MTQVRLLSVQTETPEGGVSRRTVQDRMVLGIFPRESWTRLLTEANFGHVVIAEQSGRDVFQAIAG